MILSTNNSKYILGKHWVFHFGLPGALLFMTGKVREVCLSF